MLVRCSVLSAVLIALFGVMLGSSSENQQRTAIPERQVRQVSYRGASIHDVIRHLNSMTKSDPRFELEVIPGVAATNGSVTRVSLETRTVMLAEVIQRIADIGGLKISIRDDSICFVSSNVWDVARPCPAARTVQDEPLFKFRATIPGSDQDETGCLLLKDTYPLVIELVVRPMKGLKGRNVSFVEQKDARITIEVLEADSESPLRPAYWRVRSSRRMSFTEPLRGTTLRLIHKGTLERRLPLGLYDIRVILNLEETTGDNARKALSVTETVRLRIVAESPKSEDQVCVSRWIEYAQERFIDATDGERPDLMTMVRQLGVRSVSLDLSPDDRLTLGMTAYRLGEYGTACDSLQEYLVEKYDERGDRYPVAAQCFDDACKKLGVENPFPPGSLRPPVLVPEESDGRDGRERR